MNLCLILSWDLKPPNSWEDQLRRFAGGLTLVRPLSTRTEAGRRRFLVSDLLGSRQDASLTVADARVKRLVLTHKDRLLRFGSALIFTLCEIFGTEVVIINRTESSTYEENWAQDVWEIITGFSARIYGSKSHKNRQIIKEIKQVADQIKWSHSRQNST